MSDLHRADLEDNEQWPDDPINWTPVDGPALRRQLIEQGIIRPNRAGIVAPNSPSLLVCIDCACWREGWDGKERRPSKLVNGELLVVFDKRCPLISQGRQS